MKRLLFAVAGLVAVGAIGWTVMWYAGKGRIETEMETILTAGRVGDTKITYQEYSVGGFPFKYEVEATGVEIVQVSDNATMKLPRLVVQSEGLATDRLLIRFPEQFSMRMPTQEFERAVNPALGEFREIGVTADQMIVRAIAGSEGEVAEITANRLSMDVPDPENAFVLHFDGLEASTVARGPSLPNGTMFSAKMAKVSLDGGTPASGGDPATRTRITYDNLTITGKSDVADFPALTLVAFQGAKGTVDIAWQSGKAGGVVEILDGGQGQGSITFSSGANSGLMVLNDGKLDLRSESSAISYAMDMTGPTGPMKGALTFDAMEMIIASPLAPTEAAQPMNVKMALIGLEGDDAFWANIDPGGLLNRTPAKLVVDLVATGRVTRPLNQPGGFGPPMEVSNVSVKAAELDLLGAEIRASGDVELMQPLMLPMGQMKVSIKGAEPVIEQLSKAGLIGPQQVQMGQAMLQVYTKPGATPDERLADIEMGPQGLMVNGVPVQ